MGRVKDWMMDMQEAEIQALLDANPTMTVEEAHKIACENPYEVEDKS